MTRPLSVNIWSDVVCPWCYIGQRRFERAVDIVRSGDHDHDPLDIEVTYHPYQLDPTADPNRSGPVFDAYAKKFGGPERAQQLIEHVTATAADEGLDFRLDRALRANTLRAHRLIWLADQHGLQAEMHERLMQAYFVDGLDVGDIATLVDLAAEVGLDRADVEAFMLSDRGTAEVDAELRDAAEHGITAVPTYVIDGRWAIPGAQDIDTFVRTLRKLAESA